jgi:hypothetical protein
VLSSAIQSLRSGLAHLLPAAVADIVVSPLVIADVIAEAVLDSGSALFPAAVMGAAVGWGVGRLIPVTGLSEEDDPAGASFLSAMTPAADFDPPASRKDHSDMPGSPKGYGT